MRIQLPVADAIALEPGAQVALFLTACPLDPLHGEILDTSYQAKLSEEGVARRERRSNCTSTRPFPRCCATGVPAAKSARVKPWQ